MKELNFKSILLFIACIGVLFTSCQKNELKDGPAQIVDKAANQLDIIVTDGYLHLKNWEVADSLTKLVSGMSDAEVNAWEQNLGFESSRSFSNKLFAEYEKIETIEEMQNFKSKYSSVLQFSDEENDNGFELKAGSTMYDQITSSTGKLRVGNVLYSKTEKGLKMSLVNGDVIKDLSFSISNGSRLKGYIMTDPAYASLKMAEAPVFLYDGDRRMRWYLDFYPTAEHQITTPYMNSYDLIFHYRLRLKGQKHSWLGWNDYKANMSLTNPTCYIERESYNKRYNGKIASNDQKDVYVIFADVFGGSYNNLTYSSIMKVNLPFCSFKVDNIASSGVSESKNYSFTYSGAGWSANTLPWTDFSFSY